MVLRLFVIFFTFCLELSGCLASLYIQGNETSFDFHLGVTSEIKFYVHDENRDGNGKKLHILISHKPEERIMWESKCILTQSAIDCNTTSDICICPGDNSSSNVFSLKKTFLQTDIGLWRFQSFFHHNSSKIVKVNVVDASFILTTKKYQDYDLVSAIMVPMQNSTSLQGHDSTEESLMTLSTPSNKRNTQSTATIIISVLVIIIAITTAVVVWCRLRILAKITQRILRGGTIPSNPLTDIRSEEVNVYTTPREVQQGLCEERSPRASLSRTRQSADHPGEDSVQSLHHSEMLRDSFMKVTTIDFIKSNGTTDIHLLTIATPAPAPSPPPSPPPEAGLGVEVSR